VVDKQQEAMLSSSRVKMALETVLILKQ